MTKICYLCLERNDKIKVIGKENEFNYLCYVLINPHMLFQHSLHKPAVEKWYLMKDVQTKCRVCSQITNCILNAEQSIQYKP